MPCSDGLPSASSLASDVSELRAEKRELQTRNDQLARVACDLLRLVHTMRPFSEASAETKAWAAEHQLFDHSRGETKFFGYHG